MLRKFPSGQVAQYTSRDACDMKASAVYKSVACSKMLREPHSAISSGCGQAVSNQMGSWD